jgi:serine protease Do
MDEQLPCLSCRKLVDLQADLCPHCGAGLLCDVVLRGPVAEGRLRYQLSKALAAVPGAPPVVEIQRGFLALPPVVARRVTRAYAHAALSLLAESGLRASIEKHIEKSGGGGLRPRTLVLGVAAVAVLGLAFAAWQRLVDRMEPKELKLTEKDVPLPPDLRVQPSTAVSSRVLAQRALTSAASMRCQDSVGSGFFISPELVVTNAHVLCPPGETIKVGLSNESSWSGEVVHRDSTLDLALVRAAGANASPLPLGDVGDVAAGDRVMIVGSPVGLDFTVQEGSLSSLQRSANGVAYLQLDAKVSPGNSGGPVIDAQGRVVGVVAAKVTGQSVEGIGLAIPINYVYSTALSFITPPSPAAAASSAFQQMVARAQKGSTDGALREARSATPQPAAFDERPLLIAGHVDQYGNLVARVVRITDFQPRFEEIAVTVYNGLDAFCTIKGDIAAWKELEASLAAVGLAPNEAAALARLAAGRRLYVGESALRWDLCDRTKMTRGIQIELQGASTESPRLVVR